MGNASSLLSKGLASEIDAHDAVIRFNRGFPSAAVGRKTTIVFLACTLWKKEALRYRGAFFVKRSKACRNKTPYALTRSARLGYIFNGKRPSTGFLAIVWAISCRCEAIDIYGFDGFSSGTYYSPGNETPHDGEAEIAKIHEFEAQGLLRIF